MFTIVFILVSGMKIFFPLPDKYYYDSQQECSHTAVKMAEFLNSNTLVDDKVETVQCLRNA